LSLGLKIRLASERCPVRVGARKPFTLRRFHGLS